MSEPRRASEPCRVEPAGGSWPAARIVVPAHDEAAVIERCLDGLSAALGSGRVEVVVVVNGSSDDTAERVRRWRGPGSEHLRLVELAEGSKPAAVRRGLAELGVPGTVPDTDLVSAPAPGTGPVLVLDADVELAARDLRRILAAVDVDRPVVAAVRVRLEAAGASPLPRRWARVWAALPFASDGVVGSGLLAVSGAGAARLAALPDVVNDDGWVRRQFAPGERVAVDAELLVHAPRATGALVARRARVLLGNAELARLLGPDPERTATAGLVRLVRDGRVSGLDAAAYAAAALAARVLAAYRVARGRRRLWAADPTSRVAPAAGGGARDVRSAA